MIRFKCPSCGQRLSAKEETIGKSTKYPHCAAPVRVPPVSAKEPAESPVSVKAAAEPPETAPGPPPPPAHRFSNGLLHFLCHLCGGEVGVPAMSGGRQCACPHCRQLIKAPEVVPAVGFERVNLFQTIAMVSAGGGLLLVFIFTFVALNDKESFTPPAVVASVCSVLSFGGLKAAQIAQEPSMGREAKAFVIVRGSFLPSPRSCAGSWSV